jgi:hypothetical protein
MSPKGKPNELASVSEVLGERMEWLGEVPEHWNLAKLMHFTAFPGEGTLSRFDGSELLERKTRVLVQNC